MPVAIPLAGKQGLFAGLSPGGFGYTDDFQNVLNEGRLKKTPVNYGQFKPFTKEATGEAFQNLLNTVTANPASWAPGYDPRMGSTGHSPEAAQLLGAFTGQGLSFADDTGMVSLTPGGLDIQSNQGWRAGFNPTGGSINVGPFGLQGTWAGDKSIQATINLGRQNQMIPGGEGITGGEFEGMLPPYLSQFITPKQQEQKSYPYYGFGLDRTTPLSLSGPTVDTPLSAGRALMEEQTEDYIKRNPGYRYQ